MLKFSKGGGAIMIACAVFSAAVLADDKAAKTPNENATPAPAPAASTNELAALKVQADAMKTRMGEITQKLIDVTRPLYVNRERLMKEDSELDALGKEIAAKQEALEKKLAQKYPEIAAMMKEKDALGREYTAIQAKLRDIRKKQNELTAPPEAAEKK